MMDNLNTLGQGAIDLCQANFTCRGTLKDDATILNFAQDLMYQRNPNFNDS